MSSQAITRLVRVIATEIELRASRHGRPVTLASGDFDAIAEQVAQLAIFSRRMGLVDARALAAEFGVARDWVYANADRLGAVRLGGGPRARLRFDVEKAREALIAPYGTKRPKAGMRTQKPRRTQPRRQVTPGVAVIRGRASRR